MFDLKTTKIPATAQAVRARQEEAFQFQQARHLRSVNLLARGVAHDFNNILAAILSSAELVQMDLPPKNPGHEFLGQIFASGQRAREVVHQLRNFSQRRPGERTLISLAPVVEEGVRSLRATIPGAVEIMPQIGPDCPPVLADAAQIQEAVMKLGMTAWNLLPERQGRISVRLDQCAIDGDFSARQVGLRAGPQVRITIHSPEPDLSPGVMERMFEPYAFKSPSRHHGGLELFIVQEIANENDGAVTVASTPGAGTTFHLYFPVPA